MNPIASHNQTLSFQLVLRVLIVAIEIVRKKLELTLLCILKAVLLLGVKNTFVGAVSPSLVADKLRIACRISRVKTLYRS